MPKDRVSEVTDFIGVDLVQKCFQFKNEKEESSERFEFCILTGSLQRLEELADRGTIDAELKHWGVKRIMKEHPDEGSLDGVVQDLKALVRKNFTYCTYPVNLGAGKQELHALWFGKHQMLIKLLETADKLAEKKTIGLHLLFTETTGFRKRLVSFFLSTTGRQAKDPRFCQSSRKLG